jgi:hypothetical protein
VSGRRASMVQWMALGAGAGACVGAGWGVAFEVLSWSGGTLTVYLMLWGAVPGALGGLLLGRIAAGPRSKGERRRAAMLLGAVIGGLFGLVVSPSFAPLSVPVAGASGALAGLITTLLVEQVEG